MNEVRRSHERAQESARNSWTYDSGRRDEYTILDAVSTPEDRQALTAYLESNETAERIGLATWRLRSAPTLDQIYNVIHLADRSLPTKVELGLYLDANVFGDAAKSIESAWGDRTISQMPHTSLLDEHLAGRSGEMLIAVGHVEAQDFVMRDAQGREMKLSIPLLLSKGVEHGVLVIPVGCKTAEASTPFGFLENIGTDDVEIFLRHLSLRGGTFADVIAGLRSIGEMHVQLRDALNQLDIQVIDMGDKKNQVSHVKIPYASGGPSQTSSLAKLATSSAFAERVLAGGDQLRPWWQRRWFQAILDNPLTYVTIWLLISLITWLWRKRLVSRLYDPPNANLVGLLGIITSINFVILIVGGSMLVLFLLVCAIEEMPILLFLLAGYGLVSKFAEKPPAGGRE